MKPEWKSKLRYTEKHLKTWYRFKDFLYNIDIENLQERFETKYLRVF